MSDRSGADMTDVCDEGLPMLKKSEVLQALAPVAGNELYQRCVEFAREHQGDELPASGDMHAKALRQALEPKYTLARARGVSLHGSEELILGLSDLADDEPIIGIAVNPANPHVALYLRAATHEPVGCIIVEKGD